MSIRLEMLQIARLAPRLLGEAADLVRAFLRTQLTEGGAGKDRDGGEDLYYTIFALAGLQALDCPVPIERVAAYLRTFGNGAGLDFVHLGALARCWAAIGREHTDAATISAILARLETFRTADGGYGAEDGAKHGSAYGCFVAMGAYQDLGHLPPEPLRMVQCLKLLETPDGGWSNARLLKFAAVPATAAAVTLLHQLEVPINQDVATWLRTQVHPEGGFLAVPRAPMPDLLSTATALHALAILDAPLTGPARERCLDFIDTLWTAQGGFHGHWADDHLDAEYTYYGLLALGHLAVGQP